MLSSLASSRQGGDGPALEGPIASPAPWRQVHPSSSSVQINRALILKLLYAEVYLLRKMLRTPSSSSGIDRLTRFRQRLVVGLWVLVVGVAMTGWLAGLAWVAV